MNGDLVYHEVDGFVIADIKPVNTKFHRIGLRVAKFTKKGKYITTYASTKDAANALTIELKKKQILNTLITLLLRLVLLKVILKLLMVINGDMLLMTVIL